MVSMSCTKTRRERKSYVTRKEMLAVLKTVDYFYKYHGQRFKLSLRNGHFNTRIRKYSTMARKAPRIWLPDWAKKPFYGNADELSRRPCPYITTVNRLKRLSLDLAFSKNSFETRRCLETEKLGRRTTTKPRLRPNNCKELGEKPKWEESKFPTLNWVLFWVPDTWLIVI